MLKNGCTYEGEWLKGTDIRHGKGALIGSDGTIYEGMWKDDKCNGKGRLIRTDGDIYQGDWKDNKAHG